MNDNKGRYHGPLIEFEVDTGYLIPVSLLGGILNLIPLYITFILDKSGHYHQYFIYSTGFYLVSILFSLLNLKKLRIITFICLSVLFTMITAAINFISLILWVPNNSIYSEGAILYVFFLISLFFIMIYIYSSYYFPKNQGKVWKINQWETYGVEKKDRASELRFNALLALAGVIIGPAILVGYAENVFGFLLGIVITLTLPALVVDALYGAYYVWKHPDYE